MKVLHFYKTSNLDSIGGTETVIDQLATETTKLGVDNTFLTLSNIKSFILNKNGYKIITTKRNCSIFSNDISLDSIKIFKNLAEISDIIHFHHPWPYANFVYKILNCKKNYIITYHSDIVKQKFLLKMYKPLLENFLKNASKIIVTSPNYLESSLILRNYKYKSIIIPIGLNENLYQTNIHINYNKLYGNKFFLFVGKARYYKGIEYLIQSIINMKYPLVIIGSGFSNNLNKYRNIYYLGEVSEEVKVALLKSCYALVLPSNIRSEAFGVSLLEGAMFGKPLVSCEIGTGTSYINIHKLTGLVVSPSNINDLSDALRWLWENPIDAHLMGINAAKRFNELFTSLRMAESYLNVYRNVLTNTKK